eukprot:2602444-Amphidinium_carterae.1
MGWDVEGVLACQEPPPLAVSEAFEIERGVCSRAMQLSLDLVFSSGACPSVHNCSVMLSFDIRLGYARLCQSQAWCELVHEMKICLRPDLTLTHGGSRYSHLPNSDTSYNLMMEDQCEFANALTIAWIAKVSSVTPP